MKTNEFIKEVNHLGFNVKEKKYTRANEVWLIVCEVEHTKIMGVEKNTRFLIDTYCASFIHLDDGIKEELFMYTEKKPSKKAPRGFSHCGMQHQDTPLCLNQASMRRQPSCAASCR